MSEPTWAHVKYDDIDFQAVSYYSAPKSMNEKPKSLDEVKEVKVEITFDPPWDRDMMTDEAKLELGML